MELRKAANVPCPSNVIAVAINGDNVAQHCGIVYTDTAGAVKLCDMQFEHTLGIRPLPDTYFWTTVNLDTHEALQVSVFIEFIIESEKAHRLPYSFLYTPDGFDAVGQIREGVGFTCATFVVAIFDNLKFHIVDLTTWQARPKQDARFRDRIVALAETHGPPNLATRLKSETQRFRLKPWELFGSATHRRYPVKFLRAKKLAKVVTKLVKKHS